MSSKYLLKSTRLTILPSDETNLWEAPWNISLKANDKPVIGWISFSGEKSMGTIPISIELEPIYQNQGYGTEALKVMVEWAFYHRNVYEIKAESEHENDKYINALERAGFVYRDKSGSCEHYSITKQKTAWTGLYMMIGIFIGFLVGFLINNMWVGMIIGIFVCLLSGVNMDMKERKERENVTGKHKR